MSVYGKFESAEKKYKDIIDLPHPTSRKHPRMSLEARAAQFAPFAALTGHKEELQEEHRLTRTRSYRMKSIGKSWIMYSAVFVIEKGRLSFSVSILSRIK